MERWRRVGSQLSLPPPEASHRAAAGLLYTLGDGGVWGERQGRGHAVSTTPCWMVGGAMAGQLLRRWSLGSPPAPSAQFRGGFGENVGDAGRQGSGNRYGSQVHRGKPLLICLERDRSHWGSVSSVEWRKARTVGQPWGPTKESAAPTQDPTSKLAFASRSSSVALMSRPTAYWNLGSCSSATKMAALTEAGRSRSWDNFPVGGGEWVGRQSAVAWGRSGLDGGGRLPRAARRDTASPCQKSTAAGALVRGHCWMAFRWASSTNSRRQCSFKRWVYWARRIQYSSQMTWVLRESATGVTARAMVPRGPRSTSYSATECCSCCRKLVWMRASAAHQKASHVSSMTSRFARVRSRVRARLRNVWLTRMWSCRRNHAAQVPILRSPSIRMYITICRLVSRGRGRRTECCSRKKAVKWERWTSSARADSRQVSSVAPAQGV
eukprot:EG_transcript_4392